MEDGRSESWSKLLESDTPQIPCNLSSSHFLAFAFALDDVPRINPMRREIKRQKMKNGNQSGSKTLFFSRKTPYTPPTINTIPTRVYPVIGSERISQPSITAITGLT